MMRKMLIAFTILAMACVANADIYLTIDGSEAPDKITLEPSNWIEIGVDLSAGENMDSYDLEFVLSAADAHFDSNNIAYPEQGFDLDGALIVIAGNPGPQYVWVGAGNIYSPAVNGLTTLVDNLLLHCDGLGNVTLSLVNAANDGTIIDGVGQLKGYVYDSVLIVQPEPMTIALLGLGGLLLRRRRK